MARGGGRGGGPLPLASSLELVFLSRSWQVLRGPAAIWPILARVGSGSIRGPLPLQAGWLLGLRRSRGASGRVRAQSPLFVLVDLLPEGLLLLFGKGDPDLAQHGVNVHGVVVGGGRTRLPHHCRQLPFGLLHLLLAFNDLGVDVAYVL